MVETLKKPKTLDQWYMNQLKEVGSMSKDPKTKVGAIITVDNKVKGQGYNGFPPGVLETPERWERPTKYDYTVHAEMNAIFNCDHIPRGGTIYVPFWPCGDCAKNVAAAGIKRIVIGGDYYKSELTKTILEESGVELVFLEAESDA